MLLKYVYGGITAGIRWIAISSFSFVNVHLTHLLYFLVPVWFFLPFPSFHLLHTPSFSLTPRRGIFLPNIGSVQRL